MTFRSFSILAVAAALFLVACVSGDPAGLDGFDTATITIDEQQLSVAVADTPELRSQGLMGVTDLGGLDGMLFVFEESTDGGFWMKDTLIALDIAFFDADGVFVDGLAMEPCTGDPCPVYRPSGTYRYAVEVPEGHLGFVGEGSILKPPT
ncbi:MAG: DUF192 domain-containing protein [Actinomycetota bacterium]|nr:DUF192 domain-containing protein [Actinomycetota bacterium]